MNSAGPSSTHLIGLQRELRRWRRTRLRRAGLPEAMWQSAARLARAEGVSRVSRALRLDYYKLKRLTSSTPAPPVSVVPPTFVELALIPPCGSEFSRVCRIELEDGTGAKVRMAVPGDGTTLVALAQAFWRRGR